MIASTLLCKQKEVMSLLGFDDRVFHAILKNNTVITETLIYIA